MVIFVCMVFASSVLADECDIRALKGDWVSLLNSGLDLEMLERARGDSKEPTAREAAKFIEVSSDYTDFVISLNEFSMSCYNRTVTELLAIPIVKDESETKRSWRSSLIYVSLSFQNMERGFAALSKNQGWIEETRERLEKGLGDREVLKSLEDSRSSLRNFPAYSLLQLVSATDYYGKKYHGSPLKHALKSNLVWSAK